MKTELLIECRLNLPGLERSKRVRPPSLATRGNDAELSAIIDRAPLSPSLVLSLYCFDCLNTNVLLMFHTLIPCNDFFLGQYRLAAKLRPNSLVHRP